MTLRQRLARLEAQRVTTELMQLCQVARNQAITRRTPITHWKGCPRSCEESNWVPSFNQPV